MEFDAVESAEDRSATLAEVGVRPPADRADEVWGRMRTRRPPRAQRQPAETDVAKGLAGNEC